MTLNEQERDAIADALVSPQWTEGEKFIIKWQIGILGGFSTALINAICAADEINQEKLARGFPEVVAGYKAWAYGSLAERLRKAGIPV